MKKLATLFAVLVWAIALQAADATLVVQPNSCSAMEQDTNRMGKDYRNFFLPTPDPAQCQAACAAEPHCRAWTYVKPGVQGSQARCWLKDSVPQPKRDKNCVSGLCSASAAPAAPGTVSPQGQVGAGSTGPITGTPTAPRQAVPSSPPTAAPNTGAPGPSAPSGWPQVGTGAPSTGFPGSTSPSAAGGGRNMTRRDLPSGPQAMGGETRYDGHTFFVQSAPSYNTMTEMGTEALKDFRAETEVSLIGGGQEIAGLYVSASGDPKGRPGDIFFGVHSSGLVLQYRDQSGWKDMPKKAYGRAPSVRLAIERRKGRYEFRWNGEKVGEFTGDSRPMRAMLYAGEGVQVQFRSFSWQVAEKRELPPPPAEPPRDQGKCQWVRKEGGHFGMGESYLGAAYDCVCGGMVSPSSKCPQQQPGR